MLVLSRKRDEWITLNNGEIRICVIDVRRNGAVRLGIEAPDYVTVHRQEVQDRINAEESHADEI